MKVIFRKLLFLLFSTPVLLQASADENRPIEPPLIKVAILPVSYIKDASRWEIKDMSYHIQKEIFNMLTYYNTDFEIQQTAKTMHFFVKAISAMQIFDSIQVLNWQKR
jgi:hypothetical protein